MIKVVAPNMACRVADRAIQVHGCCLTFASPFSYLLGGAGVSQDFPVAYAYVAARTLRIADGCLFQSFTF